jgi:hypothetical protein
VSQKVDRLVLAIAAAVHLAVFASIVGQPLNVNAAPRAERSVVWPLFVDTTHRRAPAADLFGVYAAGIQPPNDKDIYVDTSDPHTPVGVPYAYPFRYLPIVSQVLGPALRIFPPHAAFVAWACVIEATLAAVLVALWRASRDRGVRLVGSLTMLLSAPFFLELSMGQFTFVAIALALGSLAALARRDRAWRLAGSVAFATAATLKLFPLVVSPALLRLRGGARVLAATLAFIVGTSALYFATHTGALEAFGDVNTGGKMDGMDAGNHGLLYVVFRATRDLGVHWTPPSWTKVCAAWQAALLGAIALAVLTARRPRVLLGGAALVIGFVLSYVHVWEHHYSATILAGVVALAALVDEHGWTPRARVVACALVALALPTPFALLDPHPDPGVWDPSTAWGGLAFVPPLCKALPAAAVLAAALKGLAEGGFGLPAWIAARLAARPTTSTSA